jgi:hypothetical protein
MRQPARAPSRDQSRVLSPSVRTDLDVGGLQIVMNDPLLVRGSSQTRRTRAIPYGRCVEGEVCRLIASTSTSPKGRWSPGGGSSP